MAAPGQPHRPSNGSAHFFESASGIVIRRGTFIGTNITTAPDDTLSYLEQLHALVAPNAILNQGGRADPVQCYPGTREVVLARIEAWRSGGYLENRNLFWLSGPAGAGKSAIVQTVAETCIQRAIPMINFFLFRTDATRNHARPIPSTFAYELTQLYPSLKPVINHIIRDDPVILKSSIARQFESLVIRPILQLRSTSPASEPILVLLDGLDECEPKEDQAVILDVLHNFVTAPNSPFIALVASRTDHQITRSFNRLGSFHESIFLDDTFRPDDDIRRYLEAQFVDIKAVHPLRQFLPHDWPSDDTIWHLVRKSSGQFIYAATVARFVSDTPSIPHESLELVLSLASTGSHTPFAPLDALYTHILSQAHDLNSVLDILAAHIIITSFPWHHGIKRVTLRLVGYSSEVILSRLSDLSALVRDTDDRDGTLAFYHASFSDFLIDEGRSKGYHPDFSTVASRLMILHLKKFEPSYLTGFLPLAQIIEILPKWVKMRNVYIDDVLANCGPQNSRMKATFDRVTTFLDRLNVLYQEGDPVLRQYLFERWAVVAITSGADIGHHEKQLSPQTMLHLKLQGWLRKWDNDRWEWYALHALDRRYERLRLKHSLVPKNGFDDD